MEKTPPYFAEYKYGETDIEQLDEDYRTVRYENKVESGYKVVARSEPEQLYVRDIKRDYGELIGYDEMALAAVARYAQQNTTRQRGGLSPEYKAKLEKRIQQKLDELYFVEQKEIYSITYLEKQTDALRDAYKISVGLVKQAEVAIHQYEEALMAAVLFDSVKNRIEEGRSDTAYMMEQYSSDLGLMRKYSTLIDRFHLNTPDGVAAMKERIAEKKAAYEDKSERLKAFQQNLSMHERCLKSLKRISGEDAYGGAPGGGTVFTVPAKTELKETAKVPEKKKENNAPGGDGDR